MATPKSTKNYKMFSFINRNRDIDEKKVDKLVEEIQRKDLLNENPIKVDSKYRVLEGQHTLLAAEKLDRPIWYVFSNMAPEDIALFNQTRTSWRPYDYIKSNAATNNDSFKFIKEKIHDWSLNTNVVLEILTVSHRDIKDEKYVLSLDKRKKGLLLYRRLADINGAFDHVWSVRFIRAFKNMHNDPNYSHKQMMKKLSYNNQRLTLCATIQQYLQLLQRIYNYRSSNKIRFYSDL